MLIFAPSKFFDGLDAHADATTSDNEKSPTGFKGKCSLSIKHWRPQQENDFGDAMLAILAQAAEILVEI
jgi:hypothetical protein